jgi:hypothetical protein
VQGLIGVVGTFGLLLVARVWLELDDSRMQTFIFVIKGPVHPHGDLRGNR